MDELQFEINKLLSNQTYARLILLNKQADLLRWIGSGNVVSAQQLGRGIASAIDSANVVPNRSWPIRWHRFGEGLLIVTSFVEPSDLDLEKELQAVQQLAIILEADTLKQVPSQSLPHTEHELIDARIVSSLRHLTRKEMLAPLTRQGKIDGISKTVEETCTIFGCSRDEFLKEERNLLKYIRQGKRD